MPMRKLAAALLATALAVLCVILWQQKQAETAKLESLCQGSAGQALAHFQDYEANSDPADYTKGVAEFRSFMNAYLLLNDNSPNAEYTWCSMIYGNMAHSPESVQRSIHGLTEALEYFSRDWNDRNGFYLISVYCNSLTHGDS